MKVIMRRTVAVAAALAAVVPAASARSASAATRPGAYIVTLSSGDPAAAATRSARLRGVAVEHVYRYALRGYAARMSAAQAARLATEPGVGSVVPDQTVAIEAQTFPTGINRIDGERSSTIAGNGSGTAVNADVAVIDTGIYPQSDLNVQPGVNCSTGTGTSDRNGHGTHVAGTIGARDNASGVVGVAPGVRLYPVRVLDAQGSGSFATIICGIDWVTARASTIDVANMSLGGTGSDAGGCTGNDPMHRAICRSVNAGVTYAVAAGNESDNAANHVPAAYNEVITVSALADFNGLPGGGAAATCRSDVDDTFADFSNYGADVDLIAPGVCITSTWIGGGLNTISGTSMAAPHVTGAAALYKSTHPTARPAAVKAALQAAGNLNWTGDRDTTKERLLNVDPF